VLVSVYELHPDEDVAVDRTPPSDNAAEQSVLGAMLLSKVEKPIYSRISHRCRYH